MPLLLLILLPAVGTVYFPIINSFVIAGCLIAFRGMNLFALYKMSVGENRFEIDFVQKVVRMENNTFFLKHLVQKRCLPFINLERVFIKEISDYSEFRSTTWLRLILLDKSGSAIKAVDLGDTHPFREIGKLLRRLFEQLIAAEELNSA